MSNWRNGEALQPTGTWMNVSTPETAEYYDRDQVAYVVRSTVGVNCRILTSFGALGDSWFVGTKHDIAHDQTNEYLGKFEVVGIVNFASGATVGEIPTRSWPHWVFK
jgi:hypothetical protein